MRPISIPAVLVNAAERTPDHPMLTEGGLTLSYEKALEASQNLANSLQARGLGPGERVLLAAGTGVAYPVGVCGILLARGCVVPVNPEEPLSRIRSIMEHAECRWVVTNDQELERTLSPEQVCNPFPSEPQSSGIRCSELDLNADREAMIVFTSGTTGRSKGVVLSHRNLLVNAQEVVEYLKLTSDDSLLIFLPLSYSYGLSQLLSGMVAGARIVFLSHMFHAAHAIRTLKEQGITGFGGVPTSFQLLCDYLEQHPQQLPSLRFVMNAGGPISMTTIHRLNRLIPGVEIYNCYGCTEIGPRATYLSPQELKRRPGSIGKPLACVQLRVVKDDGSDAQPGEVGEIVLKGETLMRGYFRDPQGTERAIRPDGFHTGDLATTDADGFLYFKGRLDDVFRTGSQKVSPVEVEEVLLEHPDVLEAAVTGIPDELLGNVAMAIVVPRQGRTIDEVELRRWCSQSLPAHCIPKIITVRAALTKNPSGKIARAELRR